MKVLNVIRPMFKVGDSVPYEKDKWTKVERVRFTLKGYVYKLMSGEKEVPQSVLSDNLKKSQPRVERKNKK